VSYVSQNQQIAWGGSSEKVALRRRRALSALLATVSTCVGLCEGKGMYGLRFLRTMRYSLPCALYLNSVDGGT